MKCTEDINNLDHVDVSNQKTKYDHDECSSNTDGNINTDVTFKEDFKRFSTNSF